MVLAEEPLVSEGELVSWHEFLVAGHAPETVQVVDLVLGAHHKVVGAETPAATLTFSTKQPVKTQRQKRSESFLSLKCILTVT